MDLLVFVLFWVLGFGGTRVGNQGLTIAKQRFYHLSHISSPFCSGYFGDGVSETICLGWPPTTILWISASPVARMTGRSHRCPGLLIFNEIISVKNFS
jgi:hypothetical protein